MDGIANTAKQQQTQISSVESHGEKVQVKAPIQAPNKDVNVIQEIRDKDASVKINSVEQVEDLIKQLNNAMRPMNTNLRFGVDSQDIFYVSVIEQQTNKMIRRFPAEQAADFLPKMQEVSGMLFDTQG